MTACAPLCSLAGIRRVTNRRSPQTQPCQKRVAGVRHPVNSAQPKVAGEPRGRKKCRIKAGGRLRVPRPATPPRRAGRRFSIGGRNFNFLLWQVVGISENLIVSPFYKVTVIGGFQRFYGSRCGGHFLPPGVKPGVSFSSALTAAAILAGQGGDIYEFQEDHHARRKTSLRANLP
ncbi:hypothetical protein N510_002023 [Firmicutes bacterium ASF500]|nr:hypothetical protein N510_002023 [Firmicutes bacterium ASF500]